MIDSISEKAGADASLKRRHQRAPSPIADDRLPPHDPTAEAGVIGSILHDPARCLDELDELGLQTEWFYDQRYRVIFEAAHAMHFRTPRAPVDIITLQAELKQRGILDDLGGLPFLLALEDASPSAANVSYYAGIVREKWQLRAIVRACADIVAQARACDSEVDLLLDQLERDIGRLSELRRHRGELKIKEILFDK